MRRKSGIFPGNIFAGTGAGENELEAAGGDGLVLGVVEGHSDGKVVKGEEKGVVKPKSID